MAPGAGVSARRHEEPNGGSHATETSTRGDGRSSITSVSREFRYSQQPEEESGKQRGADRVDHCYCGDKRQARSGGGSHEPQRRIALPDREYRCPRAGGHEAGSEGYRGAGTRARSGACSGPAAIRYWFPAGYRVPSRERHRVIG